MSAQELTALLLLSAATSFTPGPNTTLSTALAANLGLRSALRFVLAVPVGWGMLLGLHGGCRQLGFDLAHAALCDLGRWSCLFGLARLALERYP